jgi:peptide deformylase
MTVKPILKMGNPGLALVSSPVDDPASEAIQGLLQDMRDTLDDVNGIGLAAPQIGVPLRVVLYCLPANRMPQGVSMAPVPWTALINPTITPLSDDKVDLWERCLSLPGLYAQVPRFKHIRIRYQNADAEWMERECHGFHATLLQHECDHLDGVLYPARMPDASALAYASEVCGPSGTYAYSVDDFEGR